MAPKAAGEIGILYEDLSLVARLSDLRDHGFRIKLWHEREGGQQLPDADLALLVLPRFRERSAIAELQQMGRRLPIVCLTTSDDPAYRAELLNLGADDCLPRRHALAELVARITAILRRTGSASQQIVIRANRLHSLHRRVELTPTECAVLRLLAQSSSDALSRTDIARRLWGESGRDKINVVAVHVGRIRAKAERVFGVSLIRTVRGAGYALQDSRLSISIA